MSGAVSGVWVAVPAHNEQELIEACVVSIQLAAARTTIPVVIGVMLDDCTDATADRIPLGVRSAEVRHRNAGAARWSGFLGASQKAGTWYATTDADSLVPPTWFEGMRESAHAGHDVRAGTIVVTDWGGRDPRLSRCHDAGYRQHVGHGHIHGANLALSAEAYHAVGGFRTMAEHEDVDLVTRCLAAGFSVDWSATTPVVTSARRHNRVPGGFGGLLTRFEEDLVP